jgi:hypothetical protein
MSATDITGKFTSILLRKKGIENRVKTSGASTAAVACWRRISCCGAPRIDPTGRPADRTSGVVAGHPYAGLALYSRAKPVDRRDRRDRCEGRSASLKTAASMGWSFWPPRPVA